MIVSRRHLLALSACLITLPALAQAPAVTPYLTARELDLTAMLPPPPPAGSMMDASEIKAVLAIQRNASPERIALAVADARQTIYHMFGRTFGAGFVPDRLPLATTFFERVGASEDAVLDPAKRFFGRTRPYMASSEIKALVPASKSGSYPSGHATRVTLSAIIVGAMLPERRAEIWARADEYAESRIVGGMHYPSDLEAARRAGTAIAAVMFADPAFRTDFEAAKAEVRTALGL